MAKRKTGKRKSKSGYRSKSQVRWAFATKQKFAHRWAREAKLKRGKKKWFRELPNKKRGKRKKR